MKLTLLVIILAILGAVAGLFFLSNNKKVAPVTINTPVTNSPTASPSPSPTENSDATQKYYSSKNLMVSFSYPASAGIKEVGNKIFVYDKSSVSGPEGGQYIEVFEKPATQSIDDAIKERFLTGKPDFCTLKVSTQDEAVTGFEKREISYPLVGDNLEELYSKHKDCGPYSISNGIAYFIYDPGHSTQYAYLSIGQYAIAFDYNAKVLKTWQQTIKFLK